MLVLPEPELGAPLYGKLCSIRASGSFVVSLTTHAEKITFMSSSLPSGRIFTDPQKQSE